jgi:lipopolysaccharide/colanic/teichoic acid biosynthesis glycosyltransferase
MRSRLSIRREVIDVLVAILLLAVVVFTTLYLLKLPNVSRLFLLLLFSSQAVLTLISRASIRAFFVRLRARGYNARYMLVVGANPAAKAFADSVEGHIELGLRPIGYLAAPNDPSLSASWDRRRPVLGPWTRSRTSCRNRGRRGGDLPQPRGLGPRRADHEVVRGRGPDRPDPADGDDDDHPRRAGSRTSTACRSCRWSTDRIGSSGSPSSALLDIVIATAALIVFSPLLLILGALIWLQDGRPILFRQERVGLHGRPFRVAKFRTMVPDAEARLIELEASNEIQGHAFKMTDDPRLSRSGRWLRRTSLDELPQLWNVVRGEMSVVGPRPPLPREVVGYDIWHRRRLSMKPGIHRPVAGRSTARSGLRSLGAPGPRLHRPLVALARCQDRRPDDPGGVGRRGALAPHSVAAYRLSSPNRSIDSLAMRFMSGIRM